MIIEKQSVIHTFKKNRVHVLWLKHILLLPFSAAPRFELPESYNEGLIFRHEEIIRLRVPMIAKPVPKVVWFFEDEPISAGSDLIIETGESFTSLKINGAKRWHCGEFRVYAENEYGEDAASILVTVTCK